jgi:hypothetical protein
MVLSGIIKNHIDLLHGNLENPETANRFLDDMTIGIWKRQDRVGEVSVSLCTA